MTDYLLLAGPATQPSRFLSVLQGHPQIGAFLNPGLGNHLFQAARSSIRQRRQAGPDGATADMVGHGRAAGRLALERHFDELRRARRTGVVIVHDPAGPMFPFEEPPAVSLLVLVRNAEAAAAAIGALGVERVVEAAREALTAFQIRVAAFGVAKERILTVEEDRLERDPAAGLAEICRMLGVAADRSSIEAMLGPSWVDAGSGGGA